MLAFAQVASATITPISVNFRTASSYHQVLSECSIWKHKASAARYSDCQQLSGCPPVRLHAFYNSRTAEWIFTKLKNG
jgi:hypothetical protein